MKHFFKRKKKQQQEPSLTLYLTEETITEFHPDKQAAASEERQSDSGHYGKQLQWGSNILAIAVCCLLAGMCYLQWQTPPQVLQYEQGTEQLINPEQPLAVDVKNEGLFASLTIEVCDYDNLEQACLLINGETAGWFSSKNLVVRVYPGDVLELDTSAYLNPCRFQVIKKSSHIREAAIETMITTENGYGWIGKISFK